MDCLTWILMTWRWPGFRPSRNECNFLLSPRLSANCGHEQKSYQRKIGWVVSSAEVKAWIRPRVSSTVKCVKALTAPLMTFCKASCKTFSCCPCGIWMCITQPLMWNKTWILKCHCCTAPTVLLTATLHVDVLQQSWERISPLAECTWDTTPEPLRRNYNFATPPHTESRLSW